MLEFGTLLRCSDLLHEEDGRSGVVAEFEKFGDVVVPVQVLCVYCEEDFARYGPAWCALEVDELVDELADFAEALEDGADVGGLSVRVL